jgi:hypothetical protein
MTRRDIHVGLKPTLSLWIGHVSLVTAVQVAFVPRTSSPSPISRRGLPADRQLAA